MCNRGRAPTVPLMKPMTVLLWSPFYISINHTKSVKDNFKWNEINIEDNFYKANNTYGGFAYAIKSNLYEIILERMNELVDPMDKLLLNLQNILKSCYVSYPNIFITDLENGKIHRKRDMEKYSKHFKWDLDNYKM